MRKGKYPSAITDTPLDQGEILTLSDEFIVTKPQNVDFLFGAPDFFSPLHTLLLPRSTICTLSTAPTLSPTASREVTSSHQKRTCPEPGGPEPISQLCCFSLLGGHQQDLCASAVWTRQSFVSPDFHGAHLDDKLCPAFVQQQMKRNFNVSWSPLALLIKTTIITREVCKLATLATNRDTPNLAQIIAGSCLLSGYFNHW